MTRQQQSTHHEAHAQERRRQAARQERRQRTSSQRHLRRRRGQRQKSQRHQQTNKRLTGPRSLDLPPAGPSTPKRRGRQAADQRSRARHDSYPGIPGSGRGTGVGPIGASSRLRGFLAQWTRRGGAHLRRATRSLPPAQLLHVGRALAPGSGRGSWDVNVPPGLLHRGRWRGPGGGISPVGCAARSSDPRTHSAPS